MRPSQRICDVGSGIENFVRFEREAQFQPEARRLAMAARRRVLELRQQFPSITAAAEFLKQQSAASRNRWQLFDAGVALGYTGQIADARACFKKVLENPPQHDWEKDLHAKTQEFTQLLGDPAAFKRRIDQAILNTRRLLHLTENAESRQTLERLRWPAHHDSSARQRGERWKNGP